MKKTARVLQLMKELNEERVGVEDALIKWEQWLDSEKEREDYEYYDPDTDELLERDKTGEGRALLERVTCLATAFQAKLCDLLGVPHQSIIDYHNLGTLRIDSPIDGGDEGVTVSIRYAREYSHTDNLVYVLTMRKLLEGEGPQVWSKRREVKDYAQDTEQLVTLIGRGYIALRLLEGGTRYYQKQ